MRQHEVGRTPGHAADVTRILPLLEVLTGPLGASAAAVFAGRGAGQVAHAGEGVADGALADAAALIVSSGSSVGLVPRRFELSGRSVVGAPLRAADGRVTGALTALGAQTPSDALVASLPALAGYIAALLEPAVGPPGAGGGADAPGAALSFALAAAGVLQASLDGVVQEANPAMSAIAGGAQLRGRSLAELVVP